MFDVVRTLCEIPGPGGQEERVQSYFVNSLKEYATEVRMTNIGNVLAHFKGKGAKLLLNAHADEVSYYVHSITEDGFLKVSPFTVQGSVTDTIQYPYCVVGQKALVLYDDIELKGVFAATSGHALKSNEAQKPLEYWDIFVDVGASSKKEVLDTGINIGAAVIWNPTTEKLFHKITGKAMDDRAGLAAMLELAKKIADRDIRFDLYMASTVQEEIGFIGASALTFEEKFDISLSLDVGPAGDIPSMEPDRIPVNLGDGPILVHKDRALIYDCQILKSIAAIASKNDIPFQHAVFIRYASDGSVMVAGNAKPSLIAFPARYTHTPFETIDQRDLENLVELLCCFLTS